MSKRVCLIPGCPILVERGLCGTHKREAERARPSSTERGYDHDHNQERARWAPRVAAGTVPCRRCLQLIGPTEPWDLGHPDDACPRPRAPEHRACNRATRSNERAATARARRDEVRAERDGATHRVPVTLVCGPPCSGKTTWVREHKAEHDVVLDYDAVAVALGSPVDHDHDSALHPLVLAALNAALDQAVRSSAPHVWLVKCSPTARDRRLATETIALTTPVDECKRRANEAGRSAVVLALLDSWQAPRVGATI